MRAPGSGARRALAGLTLGAAGMFYSRLGRRSGERRGAPEPEPAGSAEPGTEVPPATPAPPTEQASATPAPEADAPHATPEVPADELQRARSELAEELARRAGGPEA